jgi:hypothetical protein
MKKIVLSLLSITILLCSCMRTNIKDIRNCVIIKQHCGWDNLDAGYYQVKDLKTGIVQRIDVDIRDCDVYHTGDTIK